MDIERVVVRMIADATQYNRVIGQMEARLLGFMGLSGTAGGMLSVPFIALAGAVTATTTAMVAAGGTAIKLAADYQRVAVAFEVMTGSAETGKRLLAEVNQLAIETPFRSGELQEAAKQLKAFGIETDQIMPALKAMGEVSSGTGTKMERIILAFGQMKVAGRAMGPEMRQFVNAGVPMYDYLAKAMGKPVEMMKRMVEEGKVGFPDVVRAFNMMTREGGIFFNLMEKQSATAQGRWNALIETIEITLRDIGLAFFEGFNVAEGLDAARTWSVQVRSSGEEIRGFFRELSQGVTTAVQYFRFFLDGLRRIYETVTDVAEVVRNWMRDNERLIATIMTWIAVASLLRLAIYGITVVVRTLTAVLVILRSLLGITAIVGAITAAFGALSSVIFWLGGGFGLVIGVGAGLILLLEKLNPGILASAFESFGDSFVKAFRDIAEVGKVAFKGIADAVKGGDFELAFQIAFKTIEYGFKQLLAGLYAEWKKFTFFLFSAGGAGNDVTAFAALQLERAKREVKLALGGDAAKWAESDYQKAEKAILQSHSQAQAAGQAELNAEIKRIMSANNPLAEEIRRLSARAGRQLQPQAYDLEGTINKARNQYGLAMETEYRQGSIGPEVNKQIEDLVEIQARLQNSTFKTLSESQQKLYFGMKSRWRDEGLLTDDSTKNQVIIAGKLAEAEKRLRLEREASITRIEQKKMEMNQTIFDAIKGPLNSMIGLAFGIRSTPNQTFLGAIPPMMVEHKAGPEVHEMAADLRREMEKELSQGIGMAGQQFQHFNKQLDLLDKGFYGVLGKAGTAFSAVTGVPLVAGLEAKRLITGEELEFGQMSEYGKLKKWVDSRSHADPTVRGMLRGTSEAQDVINKQDRDKPVTLLEEIKQTLLRGEALSKQDAEKRDAFYRAFTEAIKDRPVPAITVGGFFPNGGK